MNFVAIAFLAITLLWARRGDKCLVNPITVTSATWLFMLVGYEVVDHGLYPLSDQFYLAFLAWIVPFQAACGVMCRIGSSGSIRHLAHPATPIITNKYLIGFVALCTVVTICMNYQRAMEYDTANYFAGLRESSVAVKQHGEASFSAIYLNFFRVAQMGYLLCLIYTLRRSQFSFKRLFYALVFGFYFLGADKGGVLTFVIGYIGILCMTGRLNTRILFRTLIFMILAVYAVQFLRGNAGEGTSIIDLLYIYIFSPLPAFDTYILHSSSDFTTYYTGDLVFKNVPFVGQLMSEAYDPVNVNFFNYEMVQVPLPTNVYTMMSGYWASWKWPGLLIGGLLHGSFWGYIYGRAQKAEVYKLLYATNLYILVFYFFHDFLMEHIGFNFRVAALLFLVLYNPMFNRPALKQS